MTVANLFISLYCRTTCTGYPACGEGVERLLEFSGRLAAEDQPHKLQLSWWTDLVGKYFTPKAVMIHTLWKENENMDENLKVYEIGVPLLPRFFLGTTQSGVKTMCLTLNDAQERLYDDRHAIVECSSAVWTYNFNNGYSVLLKGPITVRVVTTAGLPPSDSGHRLGQNCLKFDRLEFEAQSYEKFFALEDVTAGTSGNGDRGPEHDKHVNAFGVPQQVMRCLELAESCEDMGDLIAFSTEHKLGPMDALRVLGSKLREASPSLFQPSRMMNDFMDLGEGTSASKMGNLPLSSEIATAASTHISDSTAQTPQRRMGSPRPLVSPYNTSCSQENSTLPRTCCGKLREPSALEVAPGMSSWDSSYPTPDLDGLPGSTGSPGPSSVPHVHPLVRGQGLMWTLQFGGALATENRQEKHQLAWWNDLVREYFAAKAEVKLTLWKDNQRLEAKVFGGFYAKNIFPPGVLTLNSMFVPPSPTSVQSNNHHLQTVPLLKELHIPVLPRYFLTTTQCGVKSMSLTLDGAQERLDAHDGHAIVKCLKAIWTYHFDNGHTVRLKGPMTVHVVTASPNPLLHTSVYHHQRGGKARDHLLKIQQLEFEARNHEKLVALRA